jgi:hypothetical protein
METQLWIVAALTAVDLFIIALFYFHIRAHPRMNSATVCATGTGLAGFVFQAFMFFDGALLILHLVTISSILGLCWLQHLGKLSRPKVRVAE